MPVKQPIDIEALVSWALSCTGRAPWDRDDPRELALDRGCTALPRRRERVTWAQVEAYAGADAGERVSLGETWAKLLMDPHPLAVHRVPGDDAQAVLNAIEALPPDDAATVEHYGRKQCRPDRWVHVEPVRVTRTLRANRHRRRTVRIWSPCTPEARDAARVAYARWHAALVTLREALAGRLERWEVVGPRAAATPWEAMPAPASVIEPVDAD